MIKERKWNDDTQSILQNEVEFLKQEIAIKNTLIERLLTELFEKNSENFNGHSNVSTSTESTITLSQSSYDDLNNRDDIFNSREDMEKPRSQMKDKSESPSEITIHPNRYQVLDSNSSCETEFVNANVVCKHTEQNKCTTESRRPRNVVNPRPENNKLKYRKPNIVHDNASHSKDKKILLLSDSMLGRIQLYKLNNDLNAGRAVRKYFPGASPNDIANFNKHILNKEKFDVVVIHAGTNSLPRDNINDIAKEIYNIVKVCHDHGVKEVLVSGVIFRNNLTSKITQLNNHIESNTKAYDFMYINNDNINADDIWRDNIHLSDTGTAKIAINIIAAINALYI